MTQDVALPEAAMPVLGETGMIGHPPIQIEPAKPAIGQSEMDLFAQPPLRTDAHAVADDQHPHHQSGSTDGRPVPLYKDFSCVRTLSRCIGNAEFFNTISLKRTLSTY
jgi:hypothetical protein